MLNGISVEWRQRGILIKGSDGGVTFVDESHTGILKELLEVITHD